MNREQRSEHVACLLQQIKRGSKEAFAQFYDEYIEFVFRIALNTIDDRQEAEDVCHDVFLEVYQKPDSYDPARGSVAAWLAVKTRSRCLDRLRKKKPVFIDNWENVRSERGEAPPAEALVLEKAKREAVFNALQGIPPDQRHVLFHTYINGRTHRELSEEIKRPLGTVKSRIRYGLHNLKKQLVLLGWIHPGRGGEQNES